MTNTTWIPCTDYRRVSPTINIKTRPTLARYGQMMLLLSCMYVTVLFAHVHYCDTRRAISSAQPAHIALSIGELPKLCEKISILMQANVLIADWYVAYSFPHSWRHGGHNEKGQSTNQLSGRGLVLVQPMDIDISSFGCILLLDQIF